MVLSSGCRLLIGMFGFAALAAVIMNKAMSLIVVLSALPARLVSVPWSTQHTAGRAQITTRSECRGARGGPDRAEVDGR